MIPVVTFAADSASSIECVTWAVRSVINGELVDEALQDVPGAGRAIARVTDELLTRIYGTTVIGASDGEIDEQLAVLAANNGIVSSENGYSALGPQAWLVLVRVLIEAYLKRLENA
jgi:hypothetical protein